MDLKQPEPLQTPHVASFSRVAVLFRTRFCLFTFCHDCLKSVDCVVIKITVVCSSRNFSNVVIILSLTELLWKLHSLSAETKSDCFSKKCEINDTHVHHLM